MGFGSRWEQPLAALGLAVLSGLTMGLRGGDSPAPLPVGVQEHGPTYRTGWKEGHRDHKWEERSVVLDSGARCYTLKYCACVDPSHPGVRALEEGYIGMPTPTVANWYHSGFFFVRVNGQEVGELPLLDMRATERGPRGGCHLVWETPDARVRVQFLLVGGAEGLLSQVTCVPKDGKRVESLEILVRCYPSFFTSAHRRQGDRTLITPRTEGHEPSTVTLDPVADTWLLYQDTVFDVAKGEGDGPCAMLFLPEDIAAGTVELTNYPVNTVLKAAPGTQRLRFAFWDFSGRSNAEALAFLREHGEVVRKELTSIEFRPLDVASFEAAHAPAEVGRLLAAAAQDGIRFKVEAEGLVGKLVGLKTRADGGDWTAEAEFAQVAADYDALRWKLRIFALLNAK
jgi:hypothetical protein